MLRVALYLVLLLATFAHGFKLPAEDDMDLEYPDIGTVLTFLRIFSILCYQYFKVFLLIFFN